MLSLQIVSSVSGEWEVMWQATGWADAINENYDGAEDSAENYILSARSIADLMDLVRDFDDEQAEE